MILTRIVFECGPATYFIHSHTLTIIHSYWLCFKFCIMFFFWLLVLLHHHHHVRRRDNMLLDPQKKDLFHHENLYHN